MRKNCKIEDQKNEEQKERNNGIEKVRKICEIEDQKNEE